MPCFGFLLIRFLRTTAGRTDNKPPLEFNRTVCVAPSYKEFHTAFDLASILVRDFCRELFRDDSQLLPERSRDNSIRMINFGLTPDECKVRATLLSDHRVIYLVSNTYPRWPKVPSNFFFRYYRARDELLSILPYAVQPEVVVHLRQPDSHNDARLGLDEASLAALGRLLPPSTYLVTNRVEWFDTFEKNYGWSHPDWNEVVHSALKKSWGRRHASYKSDRFIKPASDWSTEQQTLMMFADWYTILKAKRVLHTHSDFSISAIHWMNIDSRSIQGYDPQANSLILQEESWIVDGETAPLIERLQAGEAKGDLRHCGYADVDAFDGKVQIDKSSVRIHHKA